MWAFRAKREPHYSLLILQKFLRKTKPSAKIASDLHKRLQLRRSPSMRFSRLFLVLLASFSAATFAKADTINFTVTITQQQNLHNIPIGTVFTGFAHYDGSIDPNFTGVPPTLTSYGFDFPSAPDSLSDFKWLFAPRHAIGQPLFIDLTYVDYSYPGASFDITGNIF